MTAPHESPDLSVLEDPTQRAAYYSKLLYWAFLEIRLAGWDGKSERCASVADALHTLPNIITGLVCGVDVRGEERYFFEGLRKAAEADGWVDDLNAWERWALENVLPTGDDDEE